MPPNNGMQRTALRAAAQREPLDREKGWVQWKGGHENAHDN